jgi:hypothetical protein
MKSDEYKYLEDTLTGRRARDLQFESQMTSMPEGSINQKAAARQRQLDSLTPEEREIEQRRYSLSVYGTSHMERYSTPIVTDRPLGRLAVPGDQIISDPQIKGHNRERPGPCQDKNGRLLLQNHAACPQNQVLQLI